MNLLFMVFAFIFSVKSSRKEPTLRNLHNREELTLKRLLHYNEKLAFLDSYEGPAFKSSILKCSSDLDLLPTNCQIQVNFIYYTYRLYFVLVIFLNALCNYIY